MMNPGALPGKGSRTYPSTSVRDTAAMLPKASSVRRKKTSIPVKPSIGSVVRYYRDLHSAPDEEFSGPYRLTSLGAWATSRAPHVFYFFRKIRLARFRLFLDLGSGDGIVACIAGLFTRSVGIEVDPFLCLTGRRATDVLGLTGRVRFICADYRFQRIRRADALYIYPDKPVLPFHELLQDWKGTLLVYGPHFAPDGFEPVEELRCGPERLRVYRKPKTGGK
ncbi:MAG: class I SAM-dependent methyltransferase [Syntrophobacteraceae bacterium]|nr:class I SAM-dependent methyltransferase [Syntrophobacteraceae bacterium]